MTPITTEILHSHLLEIAKEFHRICTKNNIPYYMLGGTQLGASRHQGFIPWDDDMDFGVPREYFNKCITCLSEELPSRYKLISMKDSDFIVGLLIKIVDTETIAKYHFVKSEEEYGVNVDIFPLDKTSGNISKFSRNWWIQIFKGVDSYRLLDIEGLPWIKKILVQSIKIAFFPLKRTSIQNFIEKHLIQQRGSYIANHSGNWKLREIVPREVFGKPTLFKFESIELYGVEKDDAYLKSLYGDWHVLPPSDKQHTHLSNLFLK